MDPSSVTGGRPGTGSRPPCRVVRTRLVRTNPRRRFRCGLTVQVRPKVKVSGQSISGTYTFTVWDAVSKKVFFTGTGKFHGHAMTQAVERSATASLTWVSRRLLPDGSRRPASIPYGRCSGFSTNSTPRATSCS